MAVAEQAGQHPRHHGAVLQRVADTARRLGAIPDDAHGAVGIAHHVGGVENQVMFAGHLDTLALTQESRVAVNQLGRHDTVADQVAPAVDILQHQIQQFRPLDQARLDVAPVLALDELGDQIQSQIRLARGSLETL